MRVNAYKLHFLSFYFSTKPNKLHFLSSQSRIYHPRIDIEKIGDRIGDGLIPRWVLYQLTYFSLLLSLKKKKNVYNY